MVEQSVFKVGRCRTVRIRTFTEATEIARAQSTPLEANDPTTAIPDHHTVQEKNVIGVAIHTEATETRAMTIAHDQIDTLEYTAVSALSIEETVMEIIIIIIIITAARTGTARDPHTEHLSTLRNQMGE